MRALPRPAAAAASRISPTRRSSSRSTRRCATRSSGSPASPSRRSSRSSRASPTIFFYRNKMEYSFARTDDGVALGLHRAGRWDEVLDIRPLLADDRSRQRHPRRGARLGARGGAPAVLAGGRQRLPAPPVVREGRNTGQALVQLVTAPGEKFEKGYFVDVLRQFPEVRSIHWAVNDTPAEVTNLPAELLWGEPAIEEELGGLRFRVRPNAFLQTNTFDGRAALRARGRGGAAHRQRDRLGSLLRDRHDRPLARDATRSTVWGIEVSEESVACALENAELNGITNAAFFAGQRRPGRRRSARALGRAGRRRRRPAARGPRRQGAAPSRHDRRAAHRLRLVQPDDARRRREDRCARSTATSCCARSPSTCSRTRRTSRRSRCWRRRPLRVRLRPLPSTGTRRAHAERMPLRLRPG